MATVVQLKRSETSGVIPTAADIAVAELAVNLADGALYTKRTDGAIIELGGGSDQAILFVDQTDMGSVADADGYSFDLGAISDAGSSTPFQYTDTNARESISVTDAGGGGSLTYNSATGVITYTGPSASDVRAHFSAGTGISITEGSISSTITQYTDSLARASISVTDSGGDGSLSYNNTTGVITYTGPSASDVRAHFSAGTGITITSGAIAVDTTTIATQSYVNTAVSNLVDSAPSTLDTLNELAAALGDDVNFSTTISTSLGNRLRIDVDNQSLTSQQKTNALTNLGITADVTELNYVDGVTSAIQTQINSKASTGKAIAMAIVFGG